MASHGRWAKTTTDSTRLVEHPRAPDDQDAWRLDDRRYGPLLVTFATRMRLDAKQRRDAPQEAMFFVKNRIVEIHARRSKEPASLRTANVKPND